MPEKKPHRPATDEELRAMRDAVYPMNENPASRQTNESWEHVKSHWRKDEAWLTEQYWKLKAVRK